MSLYKVKQSWLYTTAKRNRIPICRIAGKNYYNKKHVDEFFGTAVSVSCCSKRVTSSVRRYTVSSVSPVIITSYVLTRNRYLTSRAPLTCSGMTDNHIRRQGISCISPPSKRVNLTTESKSKPDRRLTMWWNGIMTSSRKEGFR